MEKSVYLVISKEKDYLQRYHPFSFLLLCVIAERSRFTDEIDVRNCEIGGIKTDQQYKKALKILEKRELVKIIGDLKVKFLNNNVWIVCYDNEIHEKVKQIDEMEMVKNEKKE